MKWEPIEGEKQCATCRQIKPLSGFSVHGTGAFGRHPNCRVCRGLADARRRAAKRDEPNPTEWLLPGMTVREAMDCGHLRRWRYPVEPANNLTWRIAA